MKKGRGLRSLRAKRNVQKSREFKPAIRFGKKRGGVNIHWNGVIFTVER